MMQRDTRRNARLAIHDHLKVPALYIDEATPGGVPINARVWTESKPLGDLLGNGADRQEEVPRVLFMVSEVTPARGAIVSVAEGEAYRIDLLQPRDDISIVAFVTRLKPDAAEGLPVPETA